MTNIQLIEAQCRIEQVQTVLGSGLEGQPQQQRQVNDWRGYVTAQWHTRSYSGSRRIVGQI